MDQLERRHLATSTSTTASYSSDHISIQITSEFTEEIQSTALQHCFGTTAVVNHVE